MAHSSSVNPDVTVDNLASTQHESGYEDKGPFPDDDLKQIGTSVVVKIERSCDDDDINYGGLEDLVDTVMEPDPLDEDISFPEDGAEQIVNAFQDNSTNIQNSDEPYECQICHRRFSQKYHLLDHEIIHIRKNPFQCKICQRSYNRKGFLTNHMQRYHPDTKLFQCDCCPEQFINLSELRTHIKKHIEEGFKCEVCNYEFKRKDNYQRHLKIHSVEKARPYECPYCQKRFVEKPHLRNHLATHTGEKPFLCTVCHCWFNRKGNLQRHMMRHTGEKPYECDACSRRFAQKLHLQNHFRRKHSEKPVRIKNPLNIQESKEDNTGRSKGRKPKESKKKHTEIPIRIKNPLNIQELKEENSGRSKIRIQSESKVIKKIKIKINTQKLQQSEKGRKKRTDRNGKTQQTAETDNSIQIH